MDTDDEHKREHTSERDSATRGGSSDDAPRIEVTELNGANCKTYLLSAAGEAALVDPVREHLETYRTELADRGLQLTMILETHLHADHLMLDRAGKASLGAPLIMHTASPSPLVDRHVSHGDVLRLGGAPIRVIHTPGHTPDAVCYATDGAVLTGDTLFIGGSGRTDFPGGDAGAQYDAITGHLFALPDDTVVWPAHDYRGNTSSTIGREKATNPRLAGKSRDEYIAIMCDLGLPLPDRIQQSLQVNQSGFEADEVAFPSVTEIADIDEIAADAAAQALSDADPPLVIDVREPEEFVGALGHIEGALPVPLDALEHRLPKLAGYIDRRVVVVCRAGARSASACAMLRQAGFSAVVNLAGGMLAWREAGLPVQR